VHPSNIGSNRELQYSLVGNIVDWKYIKPYLLVDCWNHSCFYDWHLSNATQVIFKVDWFGWTPSFLLAPLKTNWQTIFDGINHDVAQLRSSFLFPKFLESNQIQTLKANWNIVKWTKEYSCIYWGLNKSVDCWTLKATASENKSGHKMSTKWVLDQKWFKWTIQQLWSSPCLFNVRYTIPDWKEDRTIRKWRKCCSWNKMSDPHQLVTFPFESKLTRE
jgi:hypothetical protein